MDVSVGDTRKVVRLRTVGEECVSCHGGFGRMGGKNTIVIGGIG